MSWSQIACDGFAVLASPQNCQNPTVAARWNTLVMRRRQGFLLAAGAYDFFNLALHFFSQSQRRNPQPYCM